MTVINATSATDKLNSYRKYGNNLPLTHVDNAGVFRGGLILPGIGWLIALVGGIYSIYLLYLGLSPTMKSPVEKSGGYTAVSIIIAIDVTGLVIE